jgi:hypothetical protein
MSDPLFAQRLTESLGPDVVSTAADAVAPWLSDWRGLYKGQAQAVIRPRTTAQVAQALALCQQAGVPVVPRGGNTGLCGGAAPDSSQANVVISLDRMDKIRSVDTIANTMVAEAGCILGNLRRTAACWPPSIRRNRRCNCIRCCSRVAARACRPTNSLPANASIWCSRMPKMSRRRSPNVIPRTYCWKSPTRHPRKS